MCTKNQRSTEKKIYQEKEEIKGRRVSVYRKKKKDFCCCQRSDMKTMIIITWKRQLWRTFSVYVAHRECDLWKEIKK